jgi:hypothetical protein
MSKIKYIHCFGGSFTQGGGFEFGGNKISDDFKKLESVYGHLEKQKTQFNYSYPGQLQKIFGSDLRVINHAKSGYGNDRMYRIFYDIVSDPYFVRDENLFLIEFLGLCRKEFYSKELDDYFITNYSIVDDKFCEFLEIGQNYYYDSKHMIDKLESYKSFFETYYDKFTNYNNEIKLIYKETEFFISYLEKYKFNYLYTEPPFILNKHSFYDKSKLILFGDDKFYKTDNGFTGFGDVNKLSITNETNRVIQDMHNGYGANKLVAHIIYNRIVNDYLKTDTIPIDWSWYKNTNFIEYGKFN